MPWAPASSEGKGGTRACSIAESSYEKGRQAWVITRHAGYRKDWQYCSPVPIGAQPGMSDRLASSPYIRNHQKQLALRKPSLHCCCISIFRESRLLQLSLDR